MSNPNDLNKDRFCKKVFNGKECGGVRVWEEQPASGRRCLLCGTFTEESVPVAPSQPSLSSRK